MNYRNDPGLSGWLQCNQKCPYTTEAEGDLPKRGSVRIKSWEKKTQPGIAGFDDGESGHKPKNAGQGKEIDYFL